MQYDNDMIRILLIELVDQIGGIVKLDTKKVLRDLKEDKIKGIAVSINGDEVIVEVIDETEDQASE
jgi:hypothetical protein